MKQPKVTLKKVKTFLGMEGYGVNADVYVDGKLACVAIDSGDGGCMDFQPNYKNLEQSKALIKKLEDYCASLPKKIIKVGGKDYKHQPTMEDFINDKLMEWANEKDKKKTERLYKQAIVFGKPNGTSYKYLKYKKPLAEINKNALQLQVDVVKKQRCKNGEVILNTNLEELGITV